MQLIKGACYCTKVSFSIPSPAVWMAHCHCTQCQRLQSADFATWVGFQTNAFEIHDPENVFKKYDSGKADHGFCSHCGSSFFFQYNTKSNNPNWENEVFFARTNISTPLDITPSEHIYFDSHAPWIKINDHLPKRSESSVQRNW